MTVSFDAIVVAYNKTLSDIACMTTLTDADVIERIVVCDNSTDAAILNANAQQAERYAKVYYVPMGGNQGLAKAYNAGLTHGESPFVVIFDDDTQVPDEYIAGITRYCSSQAADIYLPMVRSRDIIMSPCIKKGLSFHTIHDPAQLGADVELSAINSGMVVRRAFYGVCRYDERLFVDAIDHRFMDQARQAHARIVVMTDVWLTQNYSQEIHDEQAQLRRLHIRACDGRTYYGGSVRGRMHAWCMIQFWKLKLAVKYRKPGIVFMHA